MAGSNNEELSILVIDDQPEMRTLALNTFEGVEKAGAATAKDGFRKFKELCPDIVFLDLNLPDRDGIELLEDMLSYDPEAFIVIMSQSQVPADVKAASQLGASGYVVKPFSRKQLLDYIAVYIHFKHELSKASPQERASKLIENLKVEVEDKYYPEHAEKAAAQEKIVCIEDASVESAPVTESEEAEVLDLSDQCVKKILSSWRLLFVDDYVVNQEHAAQMLGKLGCHVDVVDSGEDAIELFTSNPYDFVYLDSQMPGLNGYEVAERIRSFEKSAGNKDKVPIVALVENQEEADEKQWVKAGMNEFVVKPTSFAYLRGMVTKYVRRHIVVQKEVY